MTTRRQIEANRRNANKSTGPRTTAGRAVSSRNALKHGLTAQQVVTEDEDPEEFEAFYAELYEDLAPVGAREERLAEDIIVFEWRYRRIARIEAGLLNCGAQGAFIGGAFLAMMRESMATLSRYETALSRALHQARHELERLQARRRGEAVAAPLAVDVSGTVEISPGVTPPKSPQILSQDARSIPDSAVPAAGSSAESPPQALQRGS